MRRFSVSYNNLGLSEYLTTFDNSERVWGSILNQVQLRYKR